MVEKKATFKERIFDIGFVFMAASFLAFAYHFFFTHSDFAPGGINGIATMIAHLTGLPSSVMILICNLPICIAVFFTIKKSTGLLVSFYVASTVLSLFLFELLLPNFYYETDQTILTVLAGGVVSGFAIALMIKRFGMSSGTYAISAMLKKKRPTMNVIWIAFSLDCAVVVGSFFVYGFKLDPVLFTLVNLFLASKVVDLVLQGIKSAYKCEIFTEQPEEMAKELIEKLGHGVSLVPAVGMYSHEPRNLLICVVRRRQMAEFHRILRGYPNTFTYITSVSEVVGFFK